MDKLIPVIDLLKKNKFWITCSILVIAMVASWFLATGTMTSETSSNKSKITNSITNASNVMKVQPDGVEVQAHPNETTVAGMKGEIDEAVDDLVQAWKERYDAQRKEIAVWPAEVLKSPQFLEVFEKFDPPETFPEDNTGSKMLSFLQIYSQQIPKQMDKIAEFAKTKWKFSNANSSASIVGNRGRGKKGGDSRDRRDDRGGQNMGGLEREGPEDMNSIVVHWNQENQDLWHTKLTNFIGRDDHKLDTNVPSPLQVFMLQQDLWLLEAMFRIIGKVNGGATANDLAVIKRIDHIAFGREAIAVLGKIEEPNTVVGDNAKQDSQGRAGLMDSSQFSRSKRGGARSRNTEGFDTAADPSPFHGRYVNASFEPIHAKDVRSVLNGTDLPGKNLELIVAKRVPVRLGVVMDERRIADFIAQCSKSEFAFEINQVRVNKHTPGEGIKLSGTATAPDKNKQGKGRDNLTVGGGGSVAGGSMEREGGGRSQSAGADGLGEIGPVETRTNFNVEVEFYGIVKIYNKVDEARLRGTKKAGGVADGVKPPETTKP